MMRTVLTTGPAVEPVTTAEAKLHCRIDTDADDAKIVMFITAAREYIESVTGSQFITATYTGTLDRFPNDDHIVFPFAPLQSVTSVSYVDAAGATTTLDAANYDVEKPLETFGAIYVDRSTGWPTTADQRGAVTIVFKAGYGDAVTAVPERVKQAMLLLVGNWYENREATISGTIVAEVPMALRSLIQNLKVRG